MKLASFRSAGRTSWGVIDGEDIIDIGDVRASQWPTLKTFIASGEATATLAGVRDAPRVRCDTVEWLPVITDPAKVLCVGLNYETHRRETGRPEAEHPTIFMRFADSQLGHNEPIVRPHVSTALDYEGELAVVIGAGGRYIKAADALGHVAGYACYNDATLRDWQRHTHQFGPGKNFPRTGGFGPWLTTTDEIEDVRSLKLTTRVNGLVVQEAGLDQMIFSIPTLIEYCSAFTPLSPGDVIATGTPGGVGFKREPPLYLKPGDAVEVEIEGVGRLVNGVCDE